MSKKLFALLATLTVAACAEPTSTPQLAEKDPAPVSLGAAEPIAGQYIVVFKSNTTEPRRLSGLLVSRANGTMLHTYTHVVRGFAARLSDAGVEAIRKDENVAYVEQDQV